MTTDALDPGPDGTYPFWPHTGAAGTRMPTGVYLQPGPDGQPVRVDLTPTDADEQPIKLPPAS